MAEQRADEVNCKLEISASEDVSSSVFVFLFQSNLSIIPDDLRNFYLDKNGFTLKWNVKINGNIFPLHFIEIGLSISN